MRAFVVAVFLALVLTAGTVRADVDLIALVNGQYGARTETAALHDLAHQRAEYQVSYSGGVCLSNESLTHDGLVTAEVLACNTTGPVGALAQWVGSPGHDAILADASLTAIGCASEPGLNGATFYACVLTAGPPAIAPVPPIGTEPVLPGPSSPPPNVGGSVSTPAPVHLPDTAVMP